MKSLIQYLGVYGSWGLAFMYISPLFERSPFLALVLVGVISAGMGWHLVEHGQLVQNAKRDRERLDVYEGKHTPE